MMLLQHQQCLLTVQQLLEQLRQSFSLMTFACLPFPSGTVCDTSSSTTRN
ncbi:MAG: hypothetical protein F2893_01910 [Actinobacteria bacterium]|nr:hypothetical protein [Actinomycetota bacterium]